jgi:hypothetical protein
MQLVFPVSLPGVEHDGAPVEPHAPLRALHPVGHIGEVSNIVEAILTLNRRPS